MVPDAIAAVLSYEAERRIGSGDSGQRYFDQRRLRPLQFRQDQGRLAGLRALLLIYPSPTLAKLGDPLAVFDGRKEMLEQEAIRVAISDRLEPELANLKRAAAQDSDTTVPEWAVAALIDNRLDKKVREWISCPEGMAALSSEEGFREHVAALGDAATRRDFGSVPDELRELLVDVALGSPAVCALRALHRIAPDLEWDSTDLLSAAAKVAWAFRTLFNQPDAIALLRQSSEDRYWHRVLTYCSENNLQAVLDEYAHFLVDAEGLSARPSIERVDGVATAMVKALTIRPAQIDVDDVHVEGDALSVTRLKMRGRFAMRLADYQDDEGKQSYHIRFVSLLFKNSLHVPCWLKFFPCYWV